MKNILKDKTILITGGTGSFGNKFTEIVLKKHKPKAIRIFPRGEKKQYILMHPINSKGIIMTSSLTWLHMDMTNLKN